jgi:putative Ca2+/H+ antiporter (TMEM165/GDT1 family)
LDEEAGTGTGIIQPSTLFQKLTRCIPKIFLQALTLTFLAEWGDRSQLATIILAAREVLFSHLQPFLFYIF